MSTSRIMTAEENVWHGMINKVVNVEKLLWYRGGLFPQQPNLFKEDISEYLTSIEATCAVLRQTLSNDGGVGLSGQQP